MEITDKFIDLLPLSMKDAYIKMADTLSISDKCLNQLKSPMGAAWEDVLGSRDNVNIRKEK
ncbi:hypothetical protein S14_73 [Shewanella sp. phage 1/4]|uniref:hypothetical protein n=1 Tax=Shewanella phage 1/4 TaxID=1458859 RepID=UPI0004F6045E|nr:hypothetical protein S14_73 [Shewanella sp. phage 1/4]AHK11185.1 hypothetical protein S14_73 [Shewanella sp. phage 1/4]